MTITLDHLYAKLLELEQKLSGTKLGFQSSARTLKYIFCQLTNGNKDGWYELVGEKPNQLAITQPDTYWGVVQNIDFHEVSRRGDKVKFRLWMHGEDKDGNLELVIFESGESTFFARTTLAAMSQLTPVQLQSPIRIKSYIKKIEQGPNAGDNTLAISLSFGDGDHNRIDARWKANDDWQAIAQQAITNVRAASGYVPKEEREAANDSYSQPQPQYQAPAPVAPPRPAAPPILGKPAGGVRSRKDILTSINSDHLRMEDEDKKIVFPKAMSAIGQPVQTKLDTLSDSDFTRFVDEFLIAWGDSVNIERGGLQMKLYGGDCSEEFMKTMAMCGDEDPWKRAKFWANAVDMTKRSQMPQQPLPMTAPGGAPVYDDIPFARLPDIGY